MHSRVVITLSLALAAMAAAVLLLTIVVLRGPAEVAPHGTPDLGVPPSATPTDNEEAKVFDGEAIARTIAQQYQEKFGDTDVRVSCPADEPVAVGRIFYCSIDGRTERIEVTIRSDDGDYTWRPTGS